MRWVLLMILPLLLVGCFEGEQGPTGPIGPRGPQGEQGEPGSSWEFAYYQGTADGSHQIVIYIPELTLDPRPIVQLLIAVDEAHADKNAWVPVYEIAAVSVGIDYALGAIELRDLSEGYCYLIIVAVPTD